MNVHAAPGANCARLMNHTKTTLPSHSHESARMKTNLSFARLPRAACVAVALLAAAIHPVLARPTQRHFATPDQAIDALIAAAGQNDTAGLLAIYGPAGQALVLSGDPVADRTMHAAFVARYMAGHSLQRTDEHHAVLLLGKDAWPFPIPLLRRHGSWVFDTAAGAEEIINRRVGRDELRAIKICHGFVEAERQFAGSASAPVYADRIVSAPGQHDGLFWPVAAGAPQSPLGPDMARAVSEGYAAATANSGPTPYHGYYFHILTGQGEAAPGGARPYIVQGRMTGGFALVGYPARYGDSGVMSFIVDQDGIVYQKDLGPQTSAVAQAMHIFNPDAGWQPQ